MSTPSTTTIYPSPLSSITSINAQVKSHLTLSVKLTSPVTTVVSTISSVVRFEGLAHWTSEIKFYHERTEDRPDWGISIITTIDTGRPLDIGLRGEDVVFLAGEGHVPLVEIVLEPVVV